MQHLTEAPLFPLFALKKSRLFRSSSGCLREEQKNHYHISNKKPKGYLKKMRTADSIARLWLFM